MSTSTFITAMDAAIEAYLAHQRAMGRGYSTEERVLYSLRDFLAQAHAVDLDQSRFEGWCDLHRRLTANVRRSRQRIVRNFCLYRRRSEPDCFVPELSFFPRPQPYRAPVLVEPDQIGRMLALATNLTPTPGSPLRPAVLRLAVVLLYTAGLRRGELLRLILDDVEPRTGVLRIRESKFHKSRLVPLSPDAQAELHLYLDQRLTPPFDARPPSPLLCNYRRGRLRPYTGTGLSQAIHSLFDAVGVRGIDDRRPRIHDLRHYADSPIMPNPLVIPVPLQRLVSA
ncbi:MAG: tyrosine-type recombinase/integrase [Chloroflexi bacterium]|nr:tyrosine-type recombinase/integrase [Chloroflexota bacterium]